MNTRALLVSILKVAIQKHKLYCFVPLTELNKHLLLVLLREGYFNAIYIDEDNPQPLICVKFKYYHNKSVLRHIKLISKPGKKAYITYKQLKHRLSSYRNMKLLLSTSNGVMSSNQALNEKVGGEILFEYY